MGALTPTRVSDADAARADIPDAGDLFHRGIISPRVRLGGELGLPGREQSTAAKMVSATTTRRAPSPISLATAVSIVFMIGAYGTRTRWAALAALHLHDKATVEGHHVSMS
jgi:hypothetical protein